jgi:broad specificity phosphatase PhoE
MRTIFMRHGESEYNLLGLCNGDPARPVMLTVRGRAQAQATAERLMEAPIDLVFVSRFPRAQGTAAIVNRHHDAPVRIDARLDDRRNGFEGRPVADYLAAVDNDPLNFHPADGESYGQLIERVDDFLADLARVDARCILVVTHHEVLQVIHGRRHGLDARAMWRFWIGPADTFEFDGISA